MYKHQNKRYWNRMKKFIITPIVTVCALFAQAQELKFKMDISNKSVYHCIYSRLDLNNKPCAVLRISASDPKSYEFEGNVIGDVVYETGEAIVYMTQGSKKITVKNDKYGVFTYEFPKDLKYSTYQMRIIPPSGDLASLASFKFKANKKDVYARVHEHLDLNNKPCAVLRISVADPKSYVFDGSIVGDVIYETGEAIIYMTQGSKHITIKNDKYGTAKYKFPKKLEDRVVYRLRIDIKQ